MRERLVRRTLALFLASTLCPRGGGADAASRPAADLPFDVIIRHGEVIDGTGAKGVVEDVGVRGGVIVALGDLGGAKSLQVVEARGLVVAPGFINPHDHADPRALPTALNMLTQGVTTAILNPDGDGPTDIGSQLAASAKGGLAMNIGAYVGFNSVWEQVVGRTDRRPSPQDVQTMRDLVETNLKMGAFGVSAGLDYKPAYFATPQEVISVVSVAGPWRTNFPNHERLTPESGWSSKVGIGETIAIASAAGLSPEITHIKAQGHEQGSAGDILAMMRKATAQGHYTPADVYPYLAGMTALQAFLVPGWAQAGGQAAMLARFKDPALRAKIVLEANAAIAARFGTADNISLPTSGRNLGELARRDGVSGGEEALRVLETGEYVAILKFGAESDLRAFLAAPEVAITCDCGAVLPSAKGGFRGHPRFYGSWPRVLGHYVRDQKVLTLAEAVRKMTGLPASTVGLVDRGFIAPGMAADITVFDPETIIDHATYADPNALSDGVRDVLVGGAIEFEDGKATGAEGGVALTRTSHMPTRPQSTSPVARFAAKALVKAGAEDPREVDLQVSRDAFGHAGGRVTIGGAGGPLRSIRLGILQTAPGWEALTGVARDPEGREVPFSLIYDAADPVIGGGSRLLLSLAGGPWREGRVQ